MAIRFPNNQQRLVVIGRTGSGKTTGAAWHLAQRDFVRFRWIIFDFKRDALLNSIGAEPIKLGEMPKKSGLYIVQPAPNDQEGVEKYLWDIWAKENTGVFIDEGYMIGNNSEALRALLTQGRSKRIPMIVLTQRPSWITRFVFSEADFIQVFRLSDREDRKTVFRYVPVSPDIIVPEYQSIYFDVAKDRAVILTPAPVDEVIIARFAEKLENTRQGLKYI